METFEERAKSVLEQLQHAVDRLLESLECAGRAPTDIHRATTLPMKLSWKLSRLVTSPSALAGAINIPGPSNQRALLKQARKANVPEGVQDDVRESFDRFEEHVRVEAGDRRSYDSLVSVYASDSDRIMREHRRSAYMANRHIWGLEADVQLVTNIVSLSRTHPDCVDSASLYSAIGLRRLRPTRTPLITLIRGHLDEETGGALPEPAPETIGLEPEDPGPWIMREFSSPNVRDLERDEVNGHVRLTMPANHVGLRRAITVTLGAISRRAYSRYAEPSSRHAGPSTAVQLPTPLLVLDCIMDRRIIGASMPLANFYAERAPSNIGPPARSEDNLVMENVPVASLGDGLIGVHLAEVPEYKSMLAEIFDRLGADPERFAVFRTTVEYPIMLSRGELLASLPERDGDNRAM
jgi:hypothetical protein